MKKSITLAIVIGLVGVLSACSTPATTSTVGTSKDSPVTTNAPVVPKVLTATDVTTALVGALSTVKSTVVYTETTDPNKLMGRPNGYTSKTAFSDSRVAAADVEFMDSDATERGGTVEVYPTADGATARSKYLQAIFSASSMFGSEYHFQNGGILVRVTGNLTPAQSADYKAVVASLTA